MSKFEPRKEHIVKNVRKKLKCSVCPPNKGCNVKRRRKSKSKGKR